MKLCILACLLILPVHRLTADESPLSLLAAGRYMESGEIAGKLTADYKRFSSGLVLRRKSDGSFTFYGGLSLPWAAVGTLSVRGPLQELIKPGAQTASSAKYSDSPSFLLQRSWSASARKSLVLGIPGSAQISLTEGQGDLPELGLEAEWAPFSWFRCAAVCALAELPEDTDDEWIQEDGIPVYGKLLLGGLRVSLRGEHSAVSCFAGTSLHRTSPAGTYLRGSLLYDSPLLRTRFALSGLDRNYRSPRNRISPYFVSSALDLLILPVYPVKGLLRSSARLEHPPLYGNEAADLRCDVEGGAAWVFSLYSGELTRNLVIKREEGQYLWQESMSGNLGILLPGSSGACTRRVFVQGSYLLGYDVLENASVGAALRTMPLDISVSAGISRDSESCEPPEESFLIMDANMALLYDDWELRAGVSLEGDSCTFSLTGGRSFRIPTE